MMPEDWRRGFRALRMEQWHSRQEKVVGSEGAAGRSTTWHTLSTLGSNTWEHEAAQHCQTCAYQITTASPNVLQMSSGKIPYSLS